MKTARSKPVYYKSFLGNESFNGGSVYPVLTEGSVISVKNTKSIAAHTNAIHFSKSDYVQYLNNTLGSRLELYKKLRVFEVTPVGKVYKVLGGLLTPTDTYRYSSGVTLVREIEQSEVLRNLLRVILEESEYLSDEQNKKMQPVIDWINEKI